MACLHRNRKDITQGLGAERHYFCPDCHAHWYKGRFFRKVEFENYVEGDDLDDPGLDTPDLFEGIL